MLSSKAKLRCDTEVEKWDTWFRGGSEMVEVLLVVLAVFHVFRYLRLSTESYILSKGPVTRSIELHFCIRSFKIDDFNKICQT